MNWGGITGHRSGIKGKSGLVQVSSEWMAYERSAREEYLEYSERSSEAVSLNSGGILQSP
ncbi:hypothetical protein OUZ56_017422 [Daphnia magna]|uniref:Uncharacterized protein n=1 Tax=Daphnia magna TaxID=35525 RepID=A0ABR0ASR5_9CRUS|nr:hypothetical protein OUZ56_017422 [Daphnia magna]